MELSGALRYDTFPLIADFNISGVFHASLGNLLGDIKFINPTISDALSIPGLLLYPSSCPAKG